MFDLVDILKKGADDTEAEQQQEITSVLFFQTEQCRSLVKEAYRFEGLVTPVLLPNGDEQIKEHVRHENIEIVIIELNESQNVTADAERIGHLLPNNASVIVIGSEDAISTIRNLKQMGFYYLFWPITKHDLIEFVISVHENRHRNRGLGQKRKAKQVSILGCKGGTGTTFISAEIAYLLSEDKRSSCVLVDHDYQGGNVDIMMGMKQFEKRDLRPGSFASTLDNTSAQSLLTKHTKMLSVLSLTSAGMENRDIKEYTKAVIDQVAVDVNFIVDDISSVVRQTFSQDEIVDISDSVILVFPPTVSGLREAARIKQQLMEVKSSDSQLRLLLVMNYTMPQSAATVTFAEAEKYLHQKVDVVIPYIKKLDAMILDTKRISQQKGKASKALHSLASLIVGEDEPKKGFRLFSRK
ncbi:type II secretion system protein Z [Vibrio albus]|uniref:Type II secretion system protein Z n=1 Tax=Vibrio albus TaxID=2200953 RepID=A0A2U3BEP4_9VIBR|nr:type II secretion system protein Z [Vibrio albus]PWI35222.1 type II secretion system protein Z [Vibrio albus]